MKAAFTLGLAALVGTTNAFVAPVPANGFVARAPAVRASAAPASMQMKAAAAPANIFEKAMAEFGEEFPEFYKYGWGPTTKAERWNGRHAMFGWVAIIATGYCKAHGLIPNPDMALDVKTWGTLAILQGTETISNERAIILVGHVHALVMSICATVAPLSFQDKLLLEEDEEDEAPAGLIPAFVPGITPESEMYNGRMAMMGLCAVAAHSFATGTPFLDTVNQWTGGLLMPGA